MESKKRLIYVNPTVRSNAYVAFFFLLSFSILKIFLFLFVLYFLKFILFLYNRHRKLHEFLVKNVKIISEMSAICDLRLEWQL